jgi:DNA repair exonuclease SbcCD ATPase subunit
LGLDINGKVNAYNRVTDQALAKLDQAEMIVANLQDLGDYLNPIADALDLIDEQITTIQQKIENLNGRIAGLPLSLQTSIKKNPQYKLLDSQIGKIDSVSEFIQGKVPQIKTASTIAQLQIAQEALNSFSKTLLIGEKADKALTTVNKLIPNYVCTKGSSVVLLSKTGKCLIGYKKISTDM